MSSRRLLAPLFTLFALVAGCPEMPIEPAPDAFRVRRDGGPDAPVPVDAPGDADLDAAIFDDAAAEDDAFADPDAGPPPCGSPADCTDPLRPVCDGLSGTCVECSDVEPGACVVGEYCAAGVCETGCDADTDCTGAAMRCRRVDHVCVGCTVDDDCTLGSVCDPTTSECVAGCSATRGCGGATEECCGGRCLDVASDEMNCGGCGIPCGGLCMARTCTYPTDCTTLRASSPALPSGVYELDLDGDGIAEPRYCDMTTAGGGWTLVARIVRADARAHVAAASFGLVDSPTAPTGGKLSDDDINRLRQDLATSVLRLDCGASRVYFQNGARIFDAARPQNAILRCAPTAAGPYEDPPSFGPSTEPGLSSIGAAACPEVRYADPVEGCNDGTAAADGALWVRRGATQPLTGCAALHAAEPGRASGVHMVDLDGSGPRAAVRAYCDMTTDGGGWTFGMIVSSNTDTVMSSRVAGYTEFGTAAPPSATTTYGLDLTGARFREVRIQNFTRPAVVTHSTLATLTWGGTEYRSATFLPAMRFAMGGGLELRAGYVGSDPACVAPNLAIPVCLADDGSSPDLACDTDMLVSQGMLDCMGGEHCGMAVAARAWADVDCVSYSAGGPATYGLAIR